MSKNKVIQIKRGRAENLPVLRDGELAYCKDIKKLYIGNDGNNDLITGSSSSNVNAEYIILQSSPSKIPFKISIDDTGNFIVEQISDTSEDNPEDDHSSNPSIDASKYKGLIINQYYGGGSSIDETAVSHGFIELYNTTDKTISLEGLSIQYCSYLSGWEKLNLTGEIPSKHSFLIRCNLSNDGSISSPSLDITDYPVDMEWENYILNKGVTIALMATTKLINAAENPTTLNSYIDLIGSNDDKSKAVAPFFEGTVMTDQSKQKSVRRISFQDTNDNSVDCEIVDYRYPASSYNKVPRYLAYGAWDEDDEITPPDTIALPLTAKASVITNTFGADPKTERIITWNSTSERGVVTYTESGQSSSSTVESVATKTGEFNVHRAKISGLKAGATYTFKISNGTNFVLTDEYSFTTEAADVTEFTFLQMSDSQAVNQEGFDLTANAVEKVLATNPADFIIHTGDFVQDGNDEIQWRQFFNANEALYANNCLIPTTGNNDATSESQLLYTNFNYHFTAPKTGVEGVFNYSFDYGNTHFVVLHYGDKLEEQKVWLESDLASSNKKWKIVAVHNAPYTTIQEDTMIYHEVFVRNNVDLVICGHKHGYMKSKKSVTGIQYLMCGATGVKSTANSATKQEWMETFIKTYSPDINVIKVTDTEITVTANSITGSAEKTEISQLDTFTITK